MEEGAEVTPCAFNANKRSSAARPIQADMSLTTLLIIIILNAQSDIFGTVCSGHEQDVCI